MNYTKRREGNIEQPPVTTLRQLTLIFLCVAFKGLNIYSQDIKNKPLAPSQPSSGGFFMPTSEQEARWRLKPYKIVENKS